MNTISLSAKAAHFFTVRKLFKGKIFIEHPIIKDIIFIHKKLTYSMVQSPSWEASQEIPCISQNLKVHYRTHKCPLLVMSYYA